VIRAKRLEWKDLDRIGEMNFGARRKKAWAATARCPGVDALLVTHPPDVRYLTGFTGSNGAVVLAGAAKRGVGAGRFRALLFTDGRYTTQARAEARGVKVVVDKAAVAAACGWMEAAGVRRCGFDEMQMTVAGLGAMRKAVPGRVRRGMFVGVGALVARLREVKDVDEIAAMRRAALLGCELFDEIRTDRGGGGGGAGACGAAAWSGGDELRDDCGEWRTECAAAWAGDDGEAAEAGICDAGFWGGAGWLLFGYDADCTPGESVAGGVGSV
jgi:hypothetical protein